MTDPNTEQHMNPTDDLRRNPNSTNQNLTEVAPEQASPRTCGLSWPCMDHIGFDAPDTPGEQKLGSGEMKSGPSGEESND